MRYIIIKSKVTYKEINSRQKYLYDVFKIYTIPFFYDDYIELKSIPNNYADVVFLNGHNNQVYNFLKKSVPKERVIVMITCYQGLIKNINIPNKEMYFTSNVTEQLNGKEYGFEFEITNSEIDLYNCNYISIEDKIKYSFERID